jgi:hypothetical protein
VDLGGSPLLDVASQEERSSHGSGRNPIIARGQIRQDAKVWGEDSTN